LQGVLRHKRRRFLRLIKRGSPVHPDTQDVLRSLAHLDMALVTSSARGETSAILHAADLLRYFKAVVCLEDVKSPKPDPEPYLLAMRRMAVSHGIAFEHSAAGKASARAAGLDVIEISRPSEFCSILRSEFLPTAAVAGSNAAAMSPGDASHVTDQVIR
jgi:HAD superfamily hydrolase (TIGR01509 family)